MIINDITKIFYSKIKYIGDCWIWQGLTGKCGNPIIAYNKKQYSARIYSLTLIGHNASHTKPKTICNNKLCVNHDHLLFGEVARFWSKVKKDKYCWEWIGGKNDGGYGKFTLDKNSGSIFAHRYSYQLQYNINPKNKMVCHTCDNPSCVNPEHLYLGTAQDNTNDKVKRNRSNTPVGSRSSLSKLNEVDIIAIRNAIPFEQIMVTINKLTQKYKVKSDTILDILKKRSWKHI